jgi:hypothetical protein
MLPGEYLQKRRLMAGYSLRSLASDLLTLTGFGTPRQVADQRRLQLTLASAEAGTIYHPPARIDLISNFVPLDPQIYFRLVEIDESGVPLSVPGLCPNCACSFQDPCVIPVAPSAALGTSVCDTTDSDLCSACELSLSRVTPPRLQQLLAQLRNLGVATPAVRPIASNAPNTGEQ